MKKKIIEEQFSNPLLAWFDLYGRKNLPWQKPKDPYRIWLSEIMLQQTQVQTVIPYFTRFMQYFPTIHPLSNASEDEVLSLWSGLGYYSRARNLHQTAKIIVAQYQGVFPQDLQLLTNLPGIGKSTAAAILSQAFDLPTAILDGNVKRVLSRFFLIKGWSEQAQVKKTFWEMANLCMPDQRCADYTQAIMDLGATCCTSKKPDCLHCPLQAHCKAFKQQEQEEYPTKKIKKQVPVKQQQFLILQNEGGLVYLEKKPPTGLWGGLWCLPSIDKDHCPIHFISQHYHLKGDTPKHLLEFKHHFSHFHLEITALHIKTRSLENIISEPIGQWFSLNQLTTLGLAKPTQLILSKL